MFHKNFVYTQKKTEDGCSKSVARYRGLPGDFYDIDAILKPAIDQEEKKGKVGKGKKEDKSNASYEIYYSLRQVEMNIPLESEELKDEEKVYREKLFLLGSCMVPDLKVQHIPNFYLLKREDVDGEIKFSVGGITQWSDQGAEFLGREEVKTGNSFFWTQVPVRSKEHHFTIGKERHAATGQYRTVDTKLVHRHEYQRFMETVPLEENPELEHLVSRMPYSKLMLSDLVGNVALEPKVAHVSRMQPNDQKMKDLLKEALHSFQCLKPVDDTTKVLRTPAAKAARAIRFEAAKVAAAELSKNAVPKIENILEANSGKVPKDRRSFFIPFKR